MGKLTEAVNRLLSSLQITSASPGHINEVLQVDPSIDLDEALSDAVDEIDVKEQKDISESVKKVKKFDKGNVGEMQRFTSSQFGNIREFSKNPLTFIIGTVFKKLAKGAGVLILVSLITAAVKIIISELLKPGRFLDRRFKRDITKEIIAFRRREDQQKLKQGFSNIIITTMPRLRGGQDQTYNTLHDVRLGTFPQNIGQASIIQSNVSTLASGVSFSKNKGTGRRF